MSEDSESKINNLNKRLNSRKREKGTEYEDSLSPREESSAPRKWQHDDDSTDGVARESIESDNDSFLNKLLIFSGIFFVLALGFALFTIGFNDNGVSPDNIDISVSGPVSVSAGETTSLEIRVRNDNQVALEEAVLVIEYPPGSSRPESTDSRLRRVRRSVGTLSPGETKEFSSQASLFGERGESKDITIQLEYRVADSNAIFSADRNYSVEIAELPVSMSISGPEETTVGQLVNFTVDLQSNTAKPLENVAVSATYPFGFEPQDVSPEASFRQRFWSLGDLPPGASRSIEISGRFTGGGSVDQRAFRFTAGTENANEEAEVSTIFANQTKTLTVTRPFIDLALGLDSGGSNGETVTAGGSRINGNLQWQSNLESRARGAEVSVRLSGDAIDYNSVTSPTGLYRGSNQTISWNARTDEDLNIIEPGDNGQLRFTFGTKNPEALTGVTNPTVMMEAQINATTPENNDLPDNITGQISREVKLSSEADLIVDTLHDSGPFDTDGPTPPETGEQTEYTLHFSISNTTNRLQDARLQAALPAYVERVGDASDEENISYNEVSGRLVWNVGEIPPGAGYTNPPVELFMPVAITPAENQEGETPSLLRDITLSATDEFTGKMLTIEPGENPTTQRDDLEGTGESGTVED